jgi:hypothetical protein
LPPTAEPTAAPSLADRAEHLVRILQDLIAVHEQMLTIAGEHRSAISRADGAAVQACVEQQAVLIARVGQLETERLAAIAAVIPPAPHGRATIAAVAERLPEAARARILAAARALRDLVLRLQHESRVIREATTSLISHMDGLMLQVARALSQTRLYDPRGRIDPTAPVPSGLDLTH